MTALFGISGLGLGGCESLEGNIALGAAGITALGAQTPSHEVQQTYYLGVFDPQSQVEPTVYRVRLHGQSSLISSVNFASGWLPSIAVDNLGTSIKWDKDAGRISITPKGEGDLNQPDGFKTGRRLVVFGPEGFREAPADHRLVVFMGSSPEAYFNSVNEALGVVASVTQTPEDLQANDAFQRQILDVYRLTTEEHRRLERLNLELLRRLPGEE